jgi:hypothetical protein
VKAGGNFSVKTLLCSFIMLLFLLVVVVPAAERVIAHPAQITTTFGAEPGKLITVGDRIVFVDDINPGNSFAIPRSEITNLNIANGVMTLNLTQPFASPFSSGPTVMIRLSSPNTAGEIASWAGVPGTAVGEASREAVTAPPVYEYNARRDDDNGRLLVTSTEVSWQDLKHPDRSRSWTYTSIKKFERDGDDRQVKLEPYGGDTYKFKLEGGRAITNEVYNLIADRIVAARPR